MVYAMCREDRENKTGISHKIRYTKSCDVVEEDENGRKRDKLLPVVQARNKQGCQCPNISERSDNRLRLAMSFARCC